MFPVYKISAVVGGIIKIFYSFNKASNEASNDSVDELPYPSNAASIFIANCSKWGFETWSISVYYIKHVLVS